MVMESGTYPSGRMRVFAWTSPEAEAGRVECMYYDWCATAEERAKVAPAGFVGVESIQMRDGEGMVRLRRWKGTPDVDAAELLVDVRKLPFTDVGFLEAWRSLPEDPWRALLRFDETGDVSWVDWNAVLSDPDGAGVVLKNLAAVVPWDSPPTRSKRGFHVNFEDRVGTLARRHGKDADALWSRLVGGRSLSQSSDGSEKW